jgi:hypothetical protein
MVVFGSILALMSQPDIISDKTNTTTTTTIEKNRFNDTDKAREYSNKVQEEKIQLALKTNNISMCDELSNYYKEICLKKFKQGDSQ